MQQSNTKTRKKLIEVALPLDAINGASVHEKYPGIGAHPRGIHHWWARRPLAACRAVLFAQMVDDPSEHPELYPTEELQQAERERLFGLIKELVQWENVNNSELLAKANAEIRRWGYRRGERREERGERVTRAIRWSWIHLLVVGQSRLPRSSWGWRLMPVT